MSEILTEEMMLTLVATFTFYFAVGALGAFTKDLYDNFVKGRIKIELPRIFIAAVTSAFICIGSQEYLSENMSFNTIIFLGFLCGVVGFELFGYLNSLKGLKKTIQQIIKIKRCLDLGMDIDDSGQVVQNKSPTVQEDTTETPSLIIEPIIEAEHITSHDTTKDRDDSLISQVIENHLKE